MIKVSRQTKRINRRRRIRAKINGTAERPRLSIFRSNRYLYAQIINDDNGTTLATCSGSDPKVIGADLAKLAAAKKINQVVFDRGGFIFIGKIKALAEAAREAGLQF